MSGLLARKDMIKMVENKVKTGRRGGNTGNGFMKGQSGNPGGRPKLPPEFKTLARNNSLLALSTVIEILSNPRSSARDRLRAAELIMDRAWGKPSQFMDIGNEQEESPVISMEYIANLLKKPE